MARTIDPLSKATVSAPRPAAEHAKTTRTGGKAKVPAAPKVVAAPTASHSRDHVVDPPAAPLTAVHYSQSNPEPVRQNDLYGTEAKSEQSPPAFFKHASPLRLTTVSVAKALQAFTREPTAANQERLIGSLVRTIDATDAVPKINGFGAWRDQKWIRGSLIDAMKHLGLEVDDSQTGSLAKSAQFRPVHAQLSPTQQDALMKIAGDIHSNGKLLGLVPPSEKPPEKSERSILLEQLLLRDYDEYLRVQSRTDATRQPPESLEGVVVPFRFGG